MSFQYMPWLAVVQSVTFLNGQLSQLRLIVQGLIDIFLCIWKWTINSFPGFLFQIVKPFCCAIVPVFKVSGNKIKVYFFVHNSTIVFSLIDRNLREDKLIGGYFKNIWATQPSKMHLSFVPWYLFNLKVCCCCCFERNIFHFNCFVAPTAYL